MQLLPEKISLYIILFLAFLYLPSSGGADELEDNETGEKRPVLSENDCRKCHGDIVFAVSNQGGAHSTICLDCHQGHPPADMNIIPSCGRCHTGPGHFSLDNCRSCHVNPHIPLNIKLDKGLTDPCLTCHSRQNKELKAYPSRHSGFDCTACHEYHGQIQPCQNCHMPHSDNMGKKSCAKCHKAHMPLVVNYGEDIPAEYCGSCHEGVYAVLAENQTKHRKLPCIRCHEKKHGLIPACRRCHGDPHPDRIEAKFPVCRECHISAHDLLGAEVATSLFMEKLREYRRQGSEDRDQKTEDRGQMTEDGRQKQPTTDNGQPTTNNEPRTTNNQQIKRETE